MPRADAMGGDPAASHGLVQSANGWKAEVPSRLGRVQPGARGVQRPDLAVLTRPIGGSRHAEFHGESGQREGPTHCLATSPVPNCRRRGAAVVPCGLRVSARAEHSAHRGAASTMPSAVPESWHSRPSSTSDAWASGRSGGLLPGRACGRPHHGPRSLLAWPGRRCRPMRRSSPVGW